MERRGWVIRAGTIMGQLETGGARRFRWRAAAFRDGTSRVMGDCQARICEGLGVKFPGPTQRLVGRERDSREEDNVGKGTPPFASKIMGTAIRGQSGADAKLSYWAENILPFRGNR